jgi:hypothetical protein
MTSWCFASLRTSVTLRWLLLYVAPPPPGYGGAPPPGYGDAPPPGNVAPRRKPPAKQQQVQSKDNGKQQVQPKQDSKQQVEPKDQE